MLKAGAACGGASDALNTLVAGRRLAAQIRTMLKKTNERASRCRRAGCGSQSGASPARALPEASSGIAAGSGCRVLTSGRPIRGRRRISSRSARSLRRGLMSRSTRSSVMGPMRSSPPCDRHAAELTLLSVVDAKAATLCLLEGAVSLSRYACSSCDDHWPCNGFTASTVPATGLRAVGLRSAYSHLVFLLVIPAPRSGAR